MKTDRNMNKKSKLNVTERKMIQEMYDKEFKFIHDQQCLPKEQRDNKKIEKAKDRRDRFYRWLNE